MTPFALATPKLVDHGGAGGRIKALFEKYGVAPPGITYQIQLHVTKLSPLPSDVYGSQARSDFRTCGNEGA
jgi:hypothetical protein